MKQARIEGRTFVAVCSSLVESTVLANSGSGDFFTRIERQNLKLILDHHDL